MQQRSRQARKSLYPLPVCNIFFASLYNAFFSLAGRIDEMPDEYDITHRNNKNGSIIQNQFQMLKKIGFIFVHHCHHMTEGYKISFLYCNLIAIKYYTNVLTVRSKAQHFPLWISTNKVAHEKSERPHTHGRVYAAHAHGRVYAAHAHGESGPPMYG